MVQNQSEVTLSWTNPQKYVDGTLATDLTAVHILRNGKPFATEKISGPGKAQTRTFNVSGELNTAMIFSVEVETTRTKHSDPSNLASITAVDLPGVVLNLKGAMDQHRIRLDWDPPAQNPNLVDSYFVRRNDGVVTVVTETHLVDSAIEAGKDFSYVVTAARGTAAPVMGRPSSPVLVHAVDQTPPAIPEGLQPPVVSDSATVLRWDQNTEDDLAGYWVYRSDNPDSGFVKLNMEILTNSSIRDENYTPGSYYRVSAVDKSGNASDRSSPVRVP